MSYCWKNMNGKNLFFCDIKHGLTMTSYFLKLKDSFYAIPIYGLHLWSTIRPWTEKEMKLWPQNFQKSLLKICFKSIENLIGMALLIWMPHPFFKNCPDTYETPCKLIFFKNNFKHFFLTFVREIMLDFESCLITLVYFLCKAVCRPKVFLYFLPERVSIEPEKMQKKDKRF